MIDPSITGQARQFAKGAPAMAGDDARRKGLRVEAFSLASMLNSQGLRASPSFRDSGTYIEAWVTVWPVTRARLDKALTRLDLAERESKSCDFGWHDIYLIGLEVPIFVLIDDSAEAVPA